MGDRIGWLDTARAIGIVAVVAGHVTSDLAIWAAAYHFHMPLFFMLSGIVFKPASVGDVARRRAQSLLLPYVVWLAIVAAGDVLIAGITGHPLYLPWDRPFAALARATLGGTFLVGPFGIFWFVTCMYLVQVAGAAVLRRPQRQMLLIAVLLLLMALLVQRWPNPWGIFSVPLALLFFLAGVLYRRHADRLGTALAWLAAAATALATLTLPLDLKIAEAGTPVLSIVAALGACHLILIGSRWLPQVAAVTVIGRASLVIMYVHLTVYYALRGHVAESLIVTIGVALPVALWLVLRRFDLTRVLLLGERRGNPGADGMTLRVARAPLGDQQA